MISYQHAYELVRQAASGRVTPAENVPLVLAAGRVLARDIVSQEPLPAQDNSAMDGYAIVATDSIGATVECPVRLRVIGESAAGSPFGDYVDRGMAIRIMTGAVVPDGADSVVEVEATKEGDGYVTIRREVAVGHAVRHIGEDIHAGDVAIECGTRIAPSHIGLLAALGITSVPVRARPIVGILSTGSELLEPHRTPVPGQIRNSSQPALYAACQAAAAEPVMLGIVGDDREALKDAIQEGLRYDILMTTGGVSAGAYDYVTDLLPELGVEVIFHHVAIRPGAPILFGVHGAGDQRCLVFGLPGNPVSTLVTFEIFVRHALASLTGELPWVDTFPARLEVGIHKKDAKRHFVRGLVAGDKGELTVRPASTQSSSAMTSLSRANCLIVVDEASREVTAGATVLVKML